MDAASSKDKGLVRVSPDHANILMRRAVSLGCLVIIASAVLHNDMRLTVAAFFIIMLLVGSGGPRWPLAYTLFGMHAPPVSYKANIVKPGYEQVQQAFVKTLKAGREEGIQFAAYVKGECVVDLAGSTSFENKFGSDSYFLCWSSSKAVTSILMAWLVDQGHLDYSDKISNHWPEFRGGGKENITVRQVLNHTSGLHAAPKNTVLLQNIYAENISSGTMSKHIEGMECNFPKDLNKFTYHILSRGWILNEIARRVDPHKRTLGQILRAEFTKPLGIENECYLGLSEELIDPSASNERFLFNQPAPSFFWVICNNLCQLLRIPSSCKWNMNIIFTMFIIHFPMHWTNTKWFRTPKRESLYAFCKGVDYLRGESPSTNVVTSGRALAAIANVMTMRNGQILGRNALEKAVLNEETKELFPGASVTFNDGGFCSFSAKTQAFEIPGIDSALGWVGYNGSVMVFHHDGDFALAFQPSAINECLGQARVGSMTRSLANCARRLHGDDWSK